GRFAGGPDTLLVAPDDVFDVTADGSTIVYQDGTAEVELWAVGLTDALRGRFPVKQRLLSSTSFAYGVVSPEGNRVGLRRRVPGSQRSLRMQRPGEREPRDLPVSDGGEITGTWAAPDGAQLATMAWTADLESLTVRMISPTDGRATRWATFFAENGWIQWLGD